MKNRSPEVPISTPSLFFSGYFYGLCALGGLLTALFIFALLCFEGYQERQRNAELSSLRALATAKSSMDFSWSRASSWLEQIAWQLGVADRANIPSILAQYQRLWPEAGLTLYDHNAQPLSLTGVPLANTSEAPSGMDEDFPSVRPMVLKALDGEVTKDFTFFRGYLSMGVAAPVQGRTVRAIIISVPLDSFILSRFKNVVRADIVVAPLNTDGKGLMGDFSSAGSTFIPSEIPKTLWPSLVSLIKETRANPSGPVILQNDAMHGGVEMLKGGGGLPVGLLYASPLDTPEVGIPFWYVYASISSGILAGLALAGALRFRERRMAAAVAGDLYFIARNADTEPQNIWPPALRGAFRKISENLQEYRILLKNAVQERGEARALAAKADAAGRKLDTGEYQRLFDTLPVGAFQALENGQFLRVNPAFAMLLGYDSAMQMLTDCAAFSDVCLYGDGIRNPLSVIMEKGGNARHVLSLRRRDGKVRHFALICHSVTSFTGDKAGTIEGFLLDRELEEQMSHAEREAEYAKKQRASLALLLAATCRQTQSYFTPPQHAIDRMKCEEAGDEKDAPATSTPSSTRVPWPDFIALGTGAEQQIPDEIDEQEEERLERRKSVLSAKAVLSDIYQIALTEADGVAPLDVPMDFRNFMRRLCRQALPTLFSKGISLRCEIADELLVRMNGPAPLLRHALLRSLLAVTSSVEGGWASLSVTRDANAPRISGVSRLLFSASWSSFARENTSGRQDESALSAAEEGYAVFLAQVDPDNPVQTGQTLSSTLEISDEQTVIRYLAEKMHGDLLEGMFTNDLRSLQIIVPLEHLGDNSIDVGTPRADQARIMPVEEELVSVVEAAAVPFVEPQPAEAPAPDTGTVLSDAAPELKAEDAGGAEKESPVAPVAMEQPGIDAAVSAEDVLLDIPLDTRLELVEEIEAAQEQITQENELQAGITEEPEPTSLNILVMDGDEDVVGGPDYDPDAALDGEGDPAKARPLDILLIDSSLNNRLLFSMYLRETRHRITEAHDGQEGVEAFTRGRYDVVFMDMEMPLMDGYQATRIIRALEAEKHQTPTPIVGMTTYALPELRRECMLSGCTEFLSRPFSKNSLLTLLKAFTRLKNDKELS